MRSDFRWSCPGAPAAPTTLAQQTARCRDLHCDEMNDLVHGYVDGELDLVRSLEIEKHIEECSTFSRAVETLQALRSRFSSADLYRRAPAGLRERIHQSLSSTGWAEPGTKLHLRRWLAIAASIA